MPEETAKSEVSHLVSRETIEKLVIYEGELREWQGAINLVASATLNDLWRRHFLDSAQLVPFFDGKPAGALYDLGSGGGFPGLVLATALPHWQVTLIESDRRKCAFLSHVVRTLGLENVRVESARIEAALTDLSPPDVITARALKPLPILLGWQAVYSKRGQEGPEGLYLKGESHDDEIEEARADYDFDLTVTESLTQGEAGAKGAVLQVARLCVKTDQGKT